jgi:hypothetical protein
MRKARDLAVLGALAALATVGCSDEKAAEPDPAGTLERQDAFFSRNPHALTCERVLAIDTNKARQFHLAAFSLARGARVRGENRNQTWARMVYALLDLCEKADHPGYRPAADAVRLVRRGHYQLRGGPP